MIIKTKKILSIFLCCLLLVTLLGVNVVAFAAQDTVKELDVEKQLKRIDNLAQKYYDYYEEEGYIKDGKLTVDISILEQIILDENGELVDQDNVSTQGVSTSQAVAALTDIGVYKTETQIAQQCAILGTLIAADGPLPVGDFLALCLGVYFLCTHTDSIISKESYVVSQISGGVASKCGTNASSSIAQAKTQKNNRSYNHFSAWRYNGLGGGICIQSPLTEAQAISRLRSGQDVWSRSQSLALIIASKASATGTAVHDAAHNTSTYPLNLPHYHDYYRINGHSFYGGNYH